jgi:hypothetical protein
VIKGDLKLSSVSLLFPSHIGFGGGEQIVFATSDRSRVNQLYNLRCPASPCFYTEAGWSLPYSKANEAKVMKALKLKQKSK